MLQFTEKKENLKTSFGSTAFRSALPSRRRTFKEKLTTVESLLGETNETFLNFTGIHNVYDELYNVYLGLDTKINFDDYVDRAKKLYNYDVEVADNSWRNVYFNYKIANNKGRKTRGINTGINANITENVIGGIFLENYKDNDKNYAYGLKLKYEDDNNILKGFLRKRTMTIDDIENRNKNIDIYTNYARKIKLDDRVTLEAGIGAYATRSSETKIDEDTKINKRNIYAGDVSLKVSYNTGKVNTYIKPAIAFTNDTITIAQSNDESINHKIKSNKKEYSIKVGSESEIIKGLTVGTDIKFKRNDSETSKVNFGVNLEYKW